MMKFPKLQFKFFTTLFFILFLFSFQLWGRSKLDTGLINTDKAIPSVLTSYLNSAGAVSNKFVDVSEVLFQSSLTLTSSSSGNVFCNGETVQITATALVSVTAYNFLVNGVSQQNTASSTFSFTPVGTGNVTVTVIASLQNSSTLQDSIFLIQNAVQAGSIAGAASICKGTIPNTLTSISPAIINGTAVSNTATTVYQWQSSLDGITWNDILNANSETYSPQAQNATINFRRKALNLLNGKLCSDVSNIVKITVLPDLLGGNIDQSAVIECVGTNLPVLTVSGGSSGASIRYQWQSSIDGGITFTDINGETSTDLNPVPPAQTTHYKRITFVDGQSRSICSAESSVFIATINSLNPGILDTSQNVTLCTGTIPNRLESGTGGLDASSTVGVVSYQWQTSTDGVNWTFIPSATLVNYQPPAIIQNTYYRRNATSTVSTSACSATTNSILIQVFSTIIPGNILGVKDICEGDALGDLTLTNSSASSSINYQWQQSTDGVNYTDIPNTTTRLSFALTDPWYPTVTSQYRVVVESNGCSSTTAPVEIKVTPKPSITQRSGPVDTQEICPGSPITPITFEFGGSATDLVFTGVSTSTGLQATKVNSTTYEIAGTPSSSLGIQIQTLSASNCLETSVNYSIIQTARGKRPSEIRKEFDTPEATVVRIKDKWINNTLCQSGLSSTTFYATTTYTLLASPTYEWNLDPPTAGVLSTPNSNAHIVWNASFSGTVTLSVRAITCGGTSDWLHTRLHIIEDINPAPIPSAIDQPIVLDVRVGGQSSGPLPTCETTATTEDTRFFTTTTSGINDFASIRWSISNIVPGITSALSPGTINSYGIMDWAPGFWGRFDIVAEPLNCDGIVGGTVSNTIAIGQAIETTPNIVTVNNSTIPTCPIVVGQTTDFYSDQIVNWSVDNVLAGNITATGSQTATMNWNPNFGGDYVNIIATVSATCDLGSSKLLIFIPGDAKITTSSIAPVTICQGSNLAPLDFEIDGFPDSAVVSGSLPNGIKTTPIYSKNIVDVEFNGFSKAIGEEYRFELLGNSLSYLTVKINETADEFVQNIANQINNSNVSYTASRTALNTLRLTPKVAGVSIQGSIKYVTGAIVVQDIKTISKAKKTLSLTGTVTAAPGTYNFKIITTGGGSCKQAERSVQMIVTGAPFISSLTSSQTNQTVCDGTAISPISFDVQYARSAVDSGLPNGLKLNYDSITGQYTVSGVLDTKVTQTTSYNYTIQTQSNSSGCLPDASLSGTITVYPISLIKRTSATGTDNQTVCVAGPSAPFIPIQYELADGATTYTISPSLPNGFTHNRTNNIITISGSPSITTVSQTVYNYTISVNGQYCAADQIQGSITIRSDARLSLLSGIGTDRQEGATAVCNGSPITPIEYLIENANSANVTGLPPGVTGSVNGNQFLITGSPKITGSQTLFNYTVQTTGSNCLPEATISGVMEVIPDPEIDRSIILQNDIQHVTCNGASDGAVSIPSTSPQFETRFKGGQNARAQETVISYTNSPVLGDVFSITIDGNTFNHIVTASSFGGPVQTLNEVVQNLVNVINSATGTQSVSVTANIENVTSIRLIADVAGDAFALAHQISTTVTTTSAPSATVSTVVTNIARDFNFLWTGPNGFRSTSLSINNLSAGVYNLQVSIGACTAQTSFTIEEPQALSANTVFCNGSLEVTAVGGVGPYEFKLFDSNNQLLQTNNTIDLYLYTGLIPGSNYRVEITDSQCATSFQTSIQMPFELTFDANVPLVVDDYCNDGDGDGFIELGGNSGGNAFSGGSNQFTYQWTGGPSSNFQANTRDIYDLEPGVYTVTVTDQNLGCTDQQSFTIGSVNKLVITPTTNTKFNANGKIDVSCHGDETATLEISVTGGFGNYSYSWLKNGVSLVGKTQAKLENIGVGNYTVVVRDDPPAGISSSISACEARYDFEVVEPNAIIVVVNSGTTTQTFCPGDDDASLDIEIFGGVPPFTVKLNDGQAGTFTVPDNKLFTYSKLNPSATGPEYKISVEDANGCKVGTTSQTTVSYEAIKPVSFRGTVTPVDCVAGNLGSISLEIITGTLDNPENVQVEWISPYGHLYHTWESQKGKLEEITNGGTYQAKVTYKGCELYNETFTVKDVNESVYLNSVSVNGGGCNGETGSINLDIQGGNPPYTVEWQQYKALTIVDTTPTTTVTPVTSNTTTPSSSSSNTLSTSTQLEWVTLSQYANNASVNGLESGAYRAIVRDASANFNAEVCSPNVITDVITIGQYAFEINNVQLRNAKSCSSSNTKAEIQFSVINTLPNPKNIDYELEILLDTKDPKEDLIKLNQNTYKIIGVTEGNHTLEIKTGTTSQVLGGFSNCSIVYSFDVEEQLPITYRGPTDVTIDVCADFTPISLDISQISGGTPFEINSQVTYDYRWTFTPMEDELTNGNTQLFVGPSISNAQVGTYELIISDSLGCESDPILFTVNKNEDTLPFSISGSLVNTSVNSNEVVKFLPPSCTQQNDGQIGISIEGGARPYEISWYREQIISGSNDGESAVNFTPLPHFTNATYLNNLEPGKYRVKIQSQNQSCENSAATASHLFYEEDIIVPINDELYIVYGPFIDENLCQLKPGKVIVEVFDNQSEDLTFYYNNKLIAFENQNSRDGNKIYTLLIENPVQNADLVMTNKNGCELTERLLISEIGVPEFSYTTPSLEVEGVILAKEEITFTNTSEPPYSYSEWNFGDGSESQVIETDGLVAPVRHAYGIAGTYFVTLRNYSDLGCYKEHNQQIVVGKGYNIIAPNAFTPNGDLYNDRYRLLFSGFERVSFRVFDQRGDLLHSETVQQDQQIATEPLQLIGWDGQNETGSNFYTYYFSGTLITDQSEITQSGNFVLIK